MTEETKKLFDAPYKVYETRNGYNVICTNKVLPQLCWTTDKKDANRISHLPELYDALEQAVNEFCEGCLVEHGFIDEEHSYFDLIKNGCILNEKGCKAFPWLKLLQKVRDGE